MHPRVSLIFLYILRMLSLFLVLPVLSLIARDLPSHPWTWALIFSGYALTQIFLQWPLGVLSDRIGRKPVVFLGFLISAVGACYAVWAKHGDDLAIARFVQGLGAISAVLSAWLIDHTPENLRPKTLGILGALIGLSFALCMVVGPAITARYGPATLFGTMAGLALLGMLLSLCIPDTFRTQIPSKTKVVRGLWRQSALLRLNLGVLCLHACQMMIFISVPPTLVDRGLPLTQHPWMWLLVMAVALLVMMPWLRRLSLPAPIFILTLACFGLFWVQASWPWMVLMLTVFFMAFNVLEAFQPSQVSRLVGSQVRGQALGLYHSHQALGVALGGMLGAHMLQTWGPAGVWLFCGFLGMIWFFVVVYFGEYKDYGFAQQGHVNR